MSSVVSNSSQPRHETKVMDDLVWMILFPKFDYPKKFANYISSIDRLGWFIVYIFACSIDLIAFSTPEKDQNYKERFNRSCTKVILINLCAKLLDSLIDIFDLIRHIWPYKCARMLACMLYVLCVPCVRTSNQKAILSKLSLTQMLGFGRRKLM